MATTKFARVRAMGDPKVTTWSIQVFCLTAAMKPSSRSSE